MRGHQVTLLTSDPSSSRPYYPLDESIHVVNAGVGEVTRKSNWMDVVRRIATCRRVIGANRPDVVVRFMPGSTSRSEFRFWEQGIPMVASEHIGPNYASRWLERMALYLTPMIRSANHRRFGTNPEVLRSVAAQADGRGGQSGRGDNRPAQTERNNSDLARSCSRWAALPRRRITGPCCPHSPVSRPLRIGSFGWSGRATEERTRGLSRCARNQDQAQLPGAVLDVDAEYQAADLFVLPSLYESFGLATAEALLHRLPAVGFADCPGTNELIVDDCNGLLVSGPDRVQALAGTLSMLFSRPDERLRLARSPRDELEKRFGLDGIVDRWEAVLKDACA